MAEREALYFLWSQTKFLFPFIFCVVWLLKKMSAILLSSLIMCGVSEGLGFAHRYADAPQKRRKTGTYTFLFVLVRPDSSIDDCLRSDWMSVRPSTRKRKVPSLGPRTGFHPRSCAATGWFLGNPSLGKFLWRIHFLSIFGRSYATGMKWPGPPKIKELNAYAWALRVAQVNVHWQLTHSFSSLFHSPDHRKAATKWCSLKNIDPGMTEKTRKKIGDLSIYILIGSRTHNIL